MNIETLFCYGKANEPMQFRTPTSIDDMADHCERHSHIWFRATDGTARRAKVNGRVKRRAPNRILVPLKYGLYEYHSFDASNINDVLIPVTDEMLIGNSPSLSDKGPLSPCLGGRK